MNPSLLSSEKMDWTTPPSLIAGLRKQGYTLELDVCATEENSVAIRYYSERTNGLQQDWRVPNWAWCNPPYGRELPKWVDKACSESARGASVILLVPTRTDTKWFYRAAQHARECHFIRGRLSFGNGKVPAPFPSALFFFNGYSANGCRFFFCDREGTCG